MQRWMHSAAGGTIHRLKPGFAIVCVRSRKLMGQSPPKFFYKLGFLQPQRRGCAPKFVVWRVTTVIFKSISDFLSPDRKIKYCYSPRTISGLSRRADARLHQSASDGASRLASATSAAVKGFMGLRA